MVNIIVELSKYLMIILMTSYTFLCFSIFGYQDPDKKKSLLRQQNVLMFMIHIIAYLVMYLEQEDIKLLAFYLMQVVLFGTTILLYTIIYPRVSRLVVNNMCMLLCIGMIMLTRLSYSNAVKQFVIAAGGVATPADAALMMQLGAEGVFVGSGIFKSGDPKKRAAAIVKAVTNYKDQKMLAELSEDLGEAMVGINEQEIKLLMAERGK